MFTGEKLEIRTLSIDSRVTITNVRNKDIRYMNIRPRLPTHKDLKAIVITIKNMDIRHMNIDLNPSGHKTRKQRETIIDIHLIGITIQGKIVTIIKSMIMFLKTTLEHTLEATATNG